MNLSDHVSILVDLSIICDETDKVTKLKLCRPLTAYGKLMFFEFISTINWDFIDGDIDVDNKFSMFLNNMLYMYYIAFPGKKLHTILNQIVLTMAGLLQN